MYIAAQCKYMNHNNSFCHIPFNSLLKKPSQIEWLYFEKPNSTVCYLAYKMPSYTIKITNKQIVTEVVNNQTP